MATEKQILANRRNGALSQGPKSREGKSRSRWGAYKHGLAAKVLVNHGQEQQIDELARHIRRDTPPDIARELAAAEVASSRVRRYQDNLSTQIETRLLSGGESGASADATSDSVSPGLFLTDATDVGAATGETIISDLIDQLTRSERYRCRAQAQIKRAIRRKMQAI
jgi:hypothetical protein